MEKNTQGLEDRKSYRASRIVAKKFSPGDEVFYCNHACTYMADVDDYEAVVSIVIDQEEGEAVNLLVARKYLSHANVDIGDMYRAKIEEAEALVRKARNEARDQEYAAREKMESIEARVAKYKGLETFLDFMDGNIKYIITTDYGLGLVDANDYRCRYEDKYLSAVLYRYRENDIGLRISEYSDGSGSSKGMECFKTLEDAKEFVKKKLAGLDGDSLAKNDCTITTCDKLGIKDPRIEAAREDKRKKHIKYLEEQRDRTERDRERILKEIEEAKVAGVESQGDEDE